MKKTKLVALPLLAIPLTLPLISISCIDVSSLRQRQNVRLLDNSQKKTITDAFRFELTDQAKHMDKQEWISYWNKIRREFGNNAFILEGIIEGEKNLKFNEYFKVQYHKLNGFGSSHKYKFQLDMKNDIPIIKYNVLCMDLNNKPEFSKDVEVQLSSQW
ncbi:Hypothetical protein, predicted lipoprotein [Metamycoplasma auris 15026]|uniref:Lipoprotein n=1 Tax=Metamycoplasma auris 15026 TaxID=1188233 RepID=N9UZ63_9BACT|nr:hypothetical protein [Metamycoplasma auris]ENY68482.1 Hypothetical protein, predicted lipoprotein [Metamycoplasma auris 15026]